MKKMKQLLMMLAIVFVGILFAGCPGEIIDPIDPDNPEGGGNTGGNNNSKDMTFLTSIRQDGYVEMAVVKAKNGKIESTNKFDVKVEGGYNLLGFDKAQYGDYFLGVYRVKGDDRDRALLFNLKTMEWKRVPIPKDKDGNIIKGSGNYVLSPDCKKVVYEINKWVDSSTWGTLGYGGAMMVYDIQTDKLSAWDVKSYADGLPDHQNKGMPYPTPIIFSPDGRYLYCELTMKSETVMNGWTTYGEYVFRYDFEKKEYKRLDVGDAIKADGVYGMTADGKYIFMGRVWYGGGETFKIDAISGNIIEKYDEYVNIFRENRHIVSNDKMIDRGYIYYIENGKKAATNLPVIPWYNTSYQHFTQDKKKIMFKRIGEEIDYMCRLNGITPDCTDVDTICPVPKNYSEGMITIYK